MYNRNYPKHIREYVVTFSGKLHFLENRIKKYTRAYLCKNLLHIDQNSTIKVGLVCTTYESYTATQISGSLAQTNISVFFIVSLGNDRDICYLL